MGIANFLSLFRLIVGPLFLLCYGCPDCLGLSPLQNAIVLLCLLLLAELSDVCDGYLARQLGQVTAVGKLLDPIADSLYRNSTLLALTMPPVALPLGYVYLFLYRDVIINGLRTMCAMQGIVLAARWSGKMKAVIQAMSCLTIVALLVLHAAGYLSSDLLQRFSVGIVAIAAIYTVLSGMEYLYAYRKFIKNAFS